MIKVGITGCDNLRTHELVRVLIHHPDVELRWVSGRSTAGERLDQVVHGIVGDCDLTVSAAPVAGDAVDVVFVGDSRRCAAQSLDGLDLGDDTHVIDLSGSHNQAHGAGEAWTYGMSEMQRRVLVHDAHMVTVPGDAAMASLLALMPMARNLLLNHPLALHVAMGTMLLPEGGLTIDGYTADEWAAEQQREVVMALKQCQSSFAQDVSMTVTRLAERRTLAVAARMKCGVDGEMIRQLYDQYYSDHNFVFIVDRPIVTADVENTNKCLIRLDKDEAAGLLTVHAVMDGLLKGSAGNAVHVMNLMFGLHERAGLELKGTGC